MTSHEENTKGLSPTLDKEILDAARDAWGNPTFDNLRQHMERIASLAVQAQWQPIETAPKDASPILATKPGWVTPRLMCWLDGVALGKPGWRLFDGRPESGPYEPTHWMPLPAPPQAERPPEETR